MTNFSAKKLGISGAEIADFFERSGTFICKEVAAGVDDFFGQKLLLEATISSPRSRWPGHRFLSTEIDVRASNFFAKKSLAGDTNFLAEKFGVGLVPWLGMPLAATLWSWRGSRRLSLQNRGRTIPVAGPGCPVAELGGGIEAPFRRLLGSI